MIAVVFSVANQRPLQFHNRIILGRPPSPPSPPKRKPSASASASAPPSSFHYSNRVPAPSVAFESPHNSLLIPVNKPLSSSEWRRPFVNDAVTCRHHAGNGLVRPASPSRLFHGRKSTGFFLPGARRVVVLPGKLHNLSVSIPDGWVLVVEQSNHGKVWGRGRRDNFWSPFIMRLDHPRSCRRKYRSAT